MNIICNNCVGSRIYEALGREYTNPFTWCRLYRDDFIFVLNNYDTINFNNYKIVTKNNEVDNTTLYGLEIDSSFVLYFPHYKFSSKHNSPEKIGVDIYSKDIENYIIDKYKARLKRMNDKPIFVLARNYTFNQADIEYIIKHYNGKHKFVVCSEFNIDKTLTKKLYSFVKIRPGQFKTEKMARIIINTIKLK